MDKIVITREMIPETETREIEMGNGVVLEVKKHIPYEEKQAFALEYAVYRNVEDAENEIVYDNYKSMLIKTMLIAKYYTNIDVANMTDEASWSMLFDMLVYNDVYSELMDIIEDDMKYVDHITNAMINSLRQTYRRGHSLEHMIQKSFGFLFTGEDLTEVVAKAAQVNNEVVSMMNDSKQAKSDKEKKSDKIKINGGAVLNMSKKRS